jgi:N-acetylmuramoyl-L-alanine amidase
VPGVILAGRAVILAGVTVLNRADRAWCTLGPDDYRVRKSPTGPHLIFDHTTGGKWPQRVIPGAGPAGHAEQIARMWNGQDRGGGERIHSGAQILVDFDGVIYCLADLVTQAAYHAEMANEASIGIEHCTTPDGSIYQATLDASAKLHLALCEPDILSDGLGIPFQVHAAPYRNAPLARCEVGGKTKDHDGRVQSTCGDLYGILQHRDQTSERGRGDAGDALVAALVAAGAEALDYASDEDLQKGKARQEWLRRHGGRIAADGLVGPVSLAEARRQGFRRWRDVPTNLPGKALA